MHEPRLGVAYCTKCDIDDSDEPHDTKHHQGELLLVLHASLNRQDHPYAFIGVDDHAKQKRQAADWLELDDICWSMECCCVIVEDNQYTCNASQYMP